MRPRFVTKLAFEIAALVSLGGACACGSAESAMEDEVEIEQAQLTLSSSTFSTYGCTPANPGPTTPSILLNNVTGPGVNAITVHNVQMPVQGTLSNMKAHIYLSPAAFTSFSVFIRNNPETTVRFIPTAIIPAPFMWP